MSLLQASLNTIEVCGIELEALVRNSHEVMGIFTLFGVELLDAVLRVASAHVGDGEGVL